MIKLNLKRIEELEKEYQNSRISLDALHVMVDQVLSLPDPMGLNNELNLNFAYGTLLDLGVIITPDTSKTSKQLNS